MINLESQELETLLAFQYFVAFYNTLSSKQRARILKIITKSLSFN